MDRYSNRAIRVAGGYALFGVLWIVFSDRILASLVGNAAELTYVQTLKGLAYVLCTAALVFALARRVLRDQDALHIQAHASESRFQATFEQAAVGIGHVSFDGEWLRVNNKLCDLLGYSRTELLGRNFREMTHPDDLAESEDQMQRLMRGEAPSFSLEKRYVHKDGSTVWVMLTVSVARGAAGEREHFISVIEDIGARKRAEAGRQLLEAELQQAQRLEAVGRLAGGVAHDFNNMLSVISGYTESALLRCAPGDEIVEDLRQVALATERSTALTRQLLAFARREQIRPRALDLNAVLAESQKLLARLAGVDIELRFRPGAALWQVHMDPGQVDQILANFAVNSRDAIQGNGWIEIRTENLVVGAGSEASHPGMKPGEYVRLTFADSGSGIEPEVMQHLFEPFFTTKEKGKGTGLGLATIFGIVEQNQGLIAVNSVLGEGTVFTIDFPRYHGEMQEVPQAATPSAGGSETIMLVEDEQPILSLLARAIRHRGYRVLDFSDPRAALDAVRQGEKIHLLVTDVLMPHMNGAELGRKIHALQPAVKIIYMSGHTANVVLEYGLSPGEGRYLQKPFMPGVLLDEIRNSLDHDNMHPLPENT